MPIGYIDHVQDLEQTERHGVVRSLTRLCRVRFTDDELYGFGAPQDFSILAAAYAVCPPPLSNLFDFTWPLPRSPLSITSYNALVLIERNAKLTDPADLGTVDVTLKYEHVLDGPNQVLGVENGTLGIQSAAAVPPTFIFGKGRSSIVEKSTNFFYPYGITDPTDPNYAGRVEIQVAHTYIGNDKPAAGYFDTVGLPFTIKQGGEVNLPFPQANFTMQGIILTNHPQSLADRFIRVINSQPWLNKPAYTWICSDVQWEVLDTNNEGIPLFVDPLLPNTIGRTYKFIFEFQYNVDTWNPTVVFNDQRTGRPPHDVLPATNDDPQTDWATPNPLVLVQNQAINPALAPTQSVLQPAGYWNVPALPVADYDFLFFFLTFEN